MTPKQDALRIYSSVYNRIEHLIDENLSKHEKEICKGISMFVVDEIELALKNCSEVNYDLQNMEREFSHWDKTKEEIQKI